MRAFVITPRGKKGYQIDRINGDGSRTVVARLTTEAEAVARLTVLQQREEALYQRRGSA